MQQTSVWIDGQKRAASDGATFPVTNSLTKQVVGHSASSTSKDCQVCHPSSIYNIPFPIPYLSDCLQGCRCRCGARPPHLGAPTSLSQTGHLHQGTFPPFTRLLDKEVLSVGQGRNVLHGRFGACQLDRDKDGTGGGDELDQSIEG